MTERQIGTREEWQAARDELLRLEKEHTRMGDDLARKRRELPWVLVEEEYRFDTGDGTRTLAELFNGRSQLLVYHFMFGPSYEAGCPTCSSSADAVNAVLPHLHARDVTMLYVSRAPIERLLAYEQRMGWSFPWVSCGNTDFNFDLGFSYTDEQVREFAEPMLEGGAPSGVESNAAASGTDIPGYLTEGPGFSAFIEDDAAVYHTYSTQARGLEFLMGYSRSSIVLRRGATRARARSRGSAGTTSTDEHGRAVGGASDVREHRVQWARRLGEIERLDEQRRVVDLAARVPEEAPELLVDRPSAPLGLLLESPERPELTPLLHDVQHAFGPHRADELVLEVLDARVEPEPLQLDRRGARSEPRPLETATDIGLLGHVVQAGNGDVGPTRAEPLQELPDVLRSDHGDHGDAICRQVASPPRGERLERTSVADPLDEDDGARGRRHRVTAWRRTGSDTPFSSTAPTGSKAIPSGTTRSTISCVTSTCPGAACSPILAARFTVRPK